MSDITKTESSVLPFRLLRDVFRSEIRLWVPLSILMFFIASVLMSGWPSGLVPNIRYPFTYEGDGLYHSAMIQRLLEGSWYFDNERSGYPFGSNSLDFPGSDAGNFIVLKILGLILGSYSATLNIYFLLGFPVTFAVSYTVLRALHVSRSFAVAAAVVFVFLPNHFLRIKQIFYTWYFVVPLFFYYGYRLFATKSFCPGKDTKGKAIVIHSLVLLALASFGVYFAVFGVIVLAVGALAGAIRNNSINNLIFGIAALTIVSLGVLINVAPNMHHKIVHGANSEVAYRSPNESELYGLKLTQMILPLNKHRFDSFEKLRHYYYNLKFPLTYETIYSYLGLIGASGFLMLLGLTFMGLTGKKIEPRLAFFGLATFVLFIVSTIGGLATIFAMFVSPLIRGWLRVSIFIGFASIAALFIFIEVVVGRYLSHKTIPRVILPFAILASLFGLWEQTTPVCTSCNEALRNNFLDDRAFVKRIETVLPAGAAIYQLPYMQFPEYGKKHLLTDYGLFIGFLHSDKLRWSYGGINGREGDLFYRALAQQSMKKQIDIIGKIGFSGIYIDRRGFEDGGLAVEKELHSLLGAGPELISGDRQLVFYKITPTVPQVVVGTEPNEIKKRAGFFADEYGVRYLATLEEGIDFRRGDLPVFVGKLKGLSIPEPWGRWSDGNLSPSILIEFSEELPRTFTLGLRGRALGPNVGKPIKIKFGKRTESIQLSSEMENRRVRIEVESSEKALEIIPPQPISQGPDTRKLGIGFERIWIER